MNPFRFILLAYLSFFIFPTASSAFVNGVPSLPIDKRVGEIHVLDTLKIQLGQDTTSCINDSVLLQCQNLDKDVFAYEWIDSVSGVVISKERTVWVSPKTTTVYKLNVYYFSGELITNGNFEAGNKELAEGITEYKWGERKTILWQTYPELWSEGTYRIGKSPSSYHSNFYNIEDHSGRGNMMVVNGSSRGNVKVWGGKVQVTKGLKYAFSTWGITVCSPEPAKFHFTINGKQLGKDFTLKDGNVREVKWEQFYEIWEADSDVADISLVNLNTAAGGNDFAIDDISFASMRVETGKVKVRVLPHIVVGSLPNVSVCEGDRRKITVNAYGSGLTYQWGKDGGSSILSDSSVLVLSDVAKNNGGRYFCQIKGTCGLDLETFVLTVNDTLKIGSVRDSTLSVCEGTKTALSLRVTGGTVKYKWEGPGTTNWIGGAEATYLTSAVVKADEGRYHCVVSNLCGADTLYRTLNVTNKIKLESVSRDTVVCSGQAPVFRVAVNNDPALYSWTLPDGSKLSGKSVVAGHAGSYHYQVTGCGMVEGDVKLIHFEPVTRVKVQGDTVVCKNGKATFTSVVSGGQGLKYTWSGPGGFRASTPSIVVDPVVISKAGQYKLTVTDTCGTVLSDSLTLRMAKELSVDNYQSEQRVCLGSPVNLTVKAVGEKLNYQWSKKNTVWQQKEQTLHFDKVTTADSGVYHCRLSSMCGDSLVSFHLKVVEPTAIRSHTSDKYLCHGDSVDLKVEVVGEGLSYQWQKGGVNISDSVRPVLSLKNLTRSDSVLYTCVVNGECGSVAANIWVRVGDFIVLTTDSVLNLCEGDSYTFKIRVDPTCTDIYSFCWMSGNDILSKTEGLILSNVQNSRKYSCYIEANCGKDTVNLDVNVLQDPKITKITPETGLTEGINHRIEVEATGDSLFYCWVKDRGTDILTRDVGINFRPVALADAGEYEVMVYNRCSKLYGVSLLNVWKKTVITSPEKTEIAVCEGGRVNFQVEATGELDLEYDWYHKGVPDVTRTGAELLIPVVQQNDGGRYMCVAKAKGGEDTCYINLTVNVLPKVEIKGGMDVCTYEQGTAYEAQGDSGLDYKWGISGGKLLLGEITAGQVTIDWEESGQGMLRLRAKDAVTGCVTEIDSVVRIHPRPELAWILPEEVGTCQESLALAATPAGGKFWVNGVLVDVLKFTNKDIPYRVVYRYTDKYGCTDSLEKVVKVFPKPQIKAPAEVKVGACDAFTIRSVEATTGTIAWTPSLYLDRADTLHPVFTPGATTNYMVKLTDKYGCEASAPVRVTVIPLPTADLMKDTVTGVCRELTLKAEIRSAALASVVWSPAAGLSVSADQKSAEVVNKAAGRWKYITQVVDLYGCKALDSVWVTLVDKPNLEGGKAVCYPDSVTVDCSSYADFTWRDGSEMKVRTLKNIGEYWLEVTDRYGCTDGAFYTIRPQPDLGLQVEDTVAYCRDELRLDMATPAGGTYFVNGVKETTGKLVLSDKTIDYQLEYYYTDTLTTCGNVVRDTVVVALPPYVGLPEKIITGACQPVSLVVDSITAGSIRWSPAEGLSSVTEVRPLFTPGATTRYKAVSTDEYGCSAEDSILVQVVARPTVLLPEYPTIGACEKLILPVAYDGALKEGSVVWDDPEGHLSVRADHSAELITKTAGTYKFTVTVTDTLSCVAVDSVVVTVVPLPELSVHPSDTLIGVCQELTLQLDYTATRPLFTWAPAAELEVSGDGKSARLLNKIPGEHFLKATVTDIYGCEAVDSVRVTIPVPPELTFDLPSLVGYCVDSMRVDRALPVGGIYSVNGVASDVIFFTDKKTPYTVIYRYTDTTTRCESVIEKVIAVGAMPEIHLPDSVGVGRCKPVELPVERTTAGGVKWSPADYLSGDEVLHPVFTAGETGMYRVVLTDEYGCTASDSMRVKVFELPAVRVMDDTLIGGCNDLTLTLEYSTDVLKGIVWTPSADLHVNMNDYSAELLKKKTGEHLFVATVTDVFDCKASDSVRVTIDNLPELGVDREICFRDSIVVDCRSFRSFAWSDGSTEPLRVLQAVGDYTLEVTDVYGCSDDIFYGIHPLPVTGVVDTFIFEKQTMEFVLNLDSRYAPYTIRWQDGNGSDVYAVQKEGVYSVMVADNIGCTTRDTAYLEVKRMYIAAPDAFMPGTSGENSKFYLKEVNFIGDFKMYIYDRWGELVFQTNEIGFNGGWNGVFKGMDCLAGAYVWVAYNNGKVVGKGTVVLVK